VVELLEVIAGIAVYVALIALLAWSLYFAFGPQVLGVPAMIGVLVLVAGVKIVGNVGLAGLAVVVLALAAVVVVIGMAMTVGSGPLSQRHHERPPDEP
jgi:hypothetical protein